MMNMGGEGDYRIEEECRHCLEYFDLLLADS